MVAIFVVLTIIVFLLIDFVVQKVQARNADRGRAVPEATAQEVNLQSALIFKADSITVPAALFFHRGHTWIKFTSPNQARVGLDDFAQKILGRIEAIQFPRVGEPVKQGDPLFLVKVGKNKIFLPAPSDGIVTQVNTELAAAIDAIHASPFEKGWVCELKPDNISKNIQELLFGEDAVEWELHELNRMERFLRMEESPAFQLARDDALGRSWAAECEHEVLKEFSRSFFGLDPEHAHPLTEASQHV